MNLKRYLLFLIPLILLVLLRIPSLFESYWYGDEAIYAAVADEFSQGKRLYAETWDHKPPLIFWVFYPAAVIGWTGGFFLLRAFNLMLGVLTLFFIDKILKEKIASTPRFIALLFLSFFLGSTLLEGNILNAEVIFMAFNTLAVLLFFHKRNFVLAGLLVFLSIITKVPGFVELAMVFVAFVVVYFKEKNISFIVGSIAKMAVGFIIPLVLMLVYFVMNGTLADFVYANATFNRIYSLHQSNYFDVFGKQLPNTYLPLFSFASIFVFSTILYWKKRISAFAYISINLFTAEVFASLLSAKNYAHYFLQILPGVTLLLALSLHNFRKIFKLLNLTIIFIILTLLIPSYLVFERGGEVAVHAPPQEYYPYFIRGYLLDDESAKEKFWWGKADNVKKVAQYLDNNYLEYSPAYIYTSKPWVIALSDRELTNKYVVWFHLEYREEHLNEDMANMREAKMFMLDKDNQLLESVAVLLNNEFERVDEFDNFDIYVRK